MRDALAKNFSIDARRLDTDGKGEAEPIDKYKTPAGKTNNRRVEFIRRLRDWDALPRLAKAIDIEKTSCASPVAASC